MISGWASQGEALCRVLRACAHHQQYICRPIAVTTVYALLFSCDSRPQYRYTDLDLWIFVKRTHESMHLQMKKAILCASTSLLCTLQRPGKRALCSTRVAQNPSAPCREACVRVSKRKRLLVSVCLLQMHDSHQMKFELGTLPRPCAGRA